MSQEDSVASSNSTSKDSQGTRDIGTESPMKIGWNVIPTSSLSERQKFIKMLPPIGDGEAPSGWLFRVALLYGVTPTDIGKMIGVVNDPDALDFVNWYEHENERNNYIHSNERNSKKVLNHFDFRKRLLRLTRNQDFSYVYRFCPQCLAEGPVSMFRWYWRLVSSTCCERHKTVLLERCRSCNSRIDLSSGVAENYSFVDGEHALQCCPNCSALLVDERPIPVPRNLVQILVTFQRLVIEFAGNDNYKPRTLVPLELDDFLLSPFLMEERSGSFKHATGAPRLSSHIEIDWETVVGRPYYGQFLELIDGLLEL